MPTIKKNTSNSASASITIREMPARAPDSSTEELDWQEHEPSVCIPVGQTAVGWSDSTESKFPRSLPQTCTECVVNNWPRRTCYWITSLYSYHH